MANSRQHPVVLFSAHPVVSLMTWDNSLTIAS
jgi:hypothetical protein